MRYCSSCHMLYPDRETNCPDCQSALQPPQPEDYVLLVIDKEKELNLLCAALSERDIPFQEQVKGVSAGSLMSRGFQNDGSLLVPYQSYAAAKEIARTKGFRFPDDAVSVMPLDGSAARVSGGKAAKPGQKTQPKKEEPELPTWKKRLGKIIFYASVIAALAAVVILSDVVINLIKGSFAS